MTERVLQLPGPYPGFSRLPHPAQLPWQVLYVAETRNERPSVPHGHSWRAEHEGMDSSNTSGQRPAAAVSAPSCLEAMAGSLPQGMSLSQLEVAEGFLLANTPPPDSVEANGPGASQ